MKMRGSHHAGEAQSSTGFEAPNKADQSKFLDKFTKDFGRDAAKGITNEDGSVNFDKMKNFFDKKLSSVNKSGSGSAGDSDFNPMIAMMMGGAQGIIGSGDMPKQMQDKILEGITKNFGSDAANSVTNSDGTINKDKLQNFIKDKMSEIGGTDGLGSSQKTSDFDPLKALMDTMDKVEQSSGSKGTKHTHNLGKEESSRVLDKFTKDFGEDAAKSITNDDGSVNGDKLMSYLQDKLGGADDMDSTSSNAGLDFNKLLQQTYRNISSNDNNSIFDILFGNDKGNSNKTGNLVNATA